MKASSTLRLLIFTTSILATSASIALEPLHYGQPVELEGVIHIEDHFGPPNYGENPESDMKVRAAVLILNDERLVLGDPKSELDAGTYSHVRKIQLTGQEGLNLSSLEGRHVTLKGNLFERHTAHHYTDVLMFVDQVSVDK